ncbi:MAG: hypothetical protein M0003_10740 [Acidithiobacillus sp.]|nr:hypothetical protein [Acidithiobacillus sp.]
MVTTQTQADLYYNAVRNTCERDLTFMELVRGGLTRQELAVNIERRPSLWGRYAGYFRTLPSSPLRDPASLLLGENDQHREIVDRMIDVIKDVGLEILQRHPTDVVVYDRQRLVQIAYPGAQLLWMVSNSASHLFLLGVHPDENKGAKEATTFGMDFICHIQVCKKVKFSPLTPDNAAVLCDRSVPEYTASYISGGAVEVHHHGQKIATMEITTSHGQAPVTIIPESTITTTERCAIQLWAEKYQTNYADSIFAKGEITWKT